MLTAHKEDIPLDNEPVPNRPPNARSLDRMVNSIEGLRERVQGFTLEQVSEVDQRLRIMSLQLDKLQRTVKALAEIKQRMNGLQELVQKLEAESLEQCRLATLVEPMAVESTARIATLLKFQRVIKLLKEAKRGSGLLASDAQAKTSPSPNPVEVTPASKGEFATDLPTIDHDSSERLKPLLAIVEAPDESEMVLHRAPPQIHLEPVLAKPVETIVGLSTNGQQLAIELPAIEHALPEKSATETPVDVRSEDLEQAETAYDGPLEEMDFEPDELLSNEPSNAIFFDDNRASIQPREIVAEFADTRDEPAPSQETIFEEFTGTGVMERHSAIPGTETEETTVQTHRSASEDADFDQHLLDDLIKNYGEFTILPNSTPHAETKRAPKPEPTSAALQINASAPPIAPTQPNLPLPRKDGDLDRKLKKLIKDYGEYDLYSRQTSLKLKTGVVVAFLLLTLILSGFYFFSSPKPAVPASPSSTSQPQISSETAPKETAPNTESNNGEALFTSSGSNVDLPKPVETGTSHNVANKGTTKKTTK